MRCAAFFLTVIMCGNTFAHDFIFFTESAPIFLRLDLRLDGEDSTKIWQQFTDTVFASLDSDNDNLLTETECDAGTIARRLTRLGIVLPANWRQTMSSRTGSLVTKSQFTNLVRELGSSPISVNSVRPTANSSATSLFARFDLDGDGRLSSAEMNYSANIHKLDLDDDESISRDEVQAASNRLAPAMQNQNSNQMNEAIFHLDKHASQTQIVRRLLIQYDGKGRDPNGSLDAGELGLAAEELVKFDADGSGELDYFELRQWIKRTASPHLSVTVRLGERSAAALFEVTSKARIKDGTVHETRKRITLALSELQIEIEAERDGQAVDFKSLFVAQFQTADRDQNGYLELRETQGQALFTNRFATFDTDGDGKIYEDELAASAERLQAAARSHTAITFSNSGNTLFQIIDQNRDNVITQAEVDVTQGRASVWDKDANGISRDEIPRHVRLTISRGLPGMSPTGVPSRGRSTTDVRPLWLQRMDRNRNGRITRREFLGPIEDFKKLDANNDGVIEIVEALREP